MKTYKKIKETYFKAFEELQLDIVAVAADNGSMGGKNSEEIMALSRIGEDTILFDEETKQGLNIEVLEKENAEDYLKEVLSVNIKSARIKSNFTQDELSEKADISNSFLKDIESRSFKYELSKLYQLV